MSPIFITTKLEQLEYFVNYDKRTQSVSDGSYNEVMAALTDFLPSVRW